MHPTDTAQSEREFYKLNIALKSDYELYQELYSVIYACHIFAESNHNCHWKRALLQDESNFRNNKAYENASANVHHDLSR